MPKCQLKFKESFNGKMYNERNNNNNKVNIEDCQFHKCVDLKKMEVDEFIEFVPLDKEFELMKYRKSIINEDSLPFKITNKTAYSNGAIEYKISIRSNYEPSLSATNVEVIVPVPLNVMKPNILSCLNGKLKYNKEIFGLVWKISKFPGNTDYSFHATAKVSQQPGSNTTADELFLAQPLRMNFEITMHTVSNIQIKYLKIVETNNNAYKSVKWVRYHTRSNSYLAKML